VPLLAAVGFVAYHGWSLYRLKRALTVGNEQARVEAIQRLARYPTSYPPKIIAGCLDDPSESVSKQAAKTLGAMGARGAVAVPELLKVVQDSPSSSAAPVAARSLGKIGDTRAIEPLCQALTGPGPLISGASDGLLEFGEEAFPPLVKRLSSSGPEAPRACCVLLRVKDKGLEIVCRETAQFDPQQRVRLAEGAKEAGAEAARPFLERMLKDEDRRVRFAAVVDVSELFGGVAAAKRSLAPHLPQIRADLESPGLGPEELDPIIRVLAKIRDKDSVPVLIRLVSRSDAAVQALGEIGDRRAVPAMVKVLDEWLEDFGSLAEAGLSDLAPGAWAAYGRLSGAVGLNDRATAACDALGALRASEGIPVLIRAARSYDVSVSIHACEALRAIGGADAERIADEMEARNRQATQDMVRAMMFGGN
jgi:HEAT repeat protein